MDVHKVMEVCINSIKKEESFYRAIPEGSKIAIESNYYLQIRISPSKTPIDYDMDFIK